MATTIRTLIEHLGEPHNAAEQDLIARMCSIEARYNEARKREDEGPLPQQSEWQAYSASAMAEWREAIGIYGAIMTFRTTRH